MTIDSPEAARTLRSLLEGRHSCRDFTGESIPRSTIEQILGAAQRTASWCNTQPWKIYLSCGENTRRLKARLMAAALEGRAQPDMAFPAKYEGEHLARRRESGFQLYDAAGIAKGDRDASHRLALRNFELFGAPHCAIVAMPAYLGPYAAIDCGGWIANFLLAAHAHGVAAIAQAALAQHAPVLREHFGIPEEHVVVCGIAFGFEKPSAVNAYRTRRAPVDEACVWLDA